MPKTVPEYSLCKVYKLVSPQTDKVYIGSTCQKYLSSRLAGHKCHYKKYLNGTCNYITSFDIVKYDDCKIVLIQSYTDCKNNMEQRMHEQDWIDIYDCVNKQRAYLSPEQKEEDKKRADKMYRENNKEKLKEYKSMIIKCECGAELTRNHLASHIKETKKHQKYIDSLKS
jgi:hypothetical protein